VLRGAVVLWGLLSCTNACAQVSGSATLLSDYRFRGVSLSDGQPAAQLGVAWERDDGWYAGAFASSTRLYGHPGTQLLAYLGYARRLHGGLSWEAGAEYAAFSRYPGDNYPEFYLGLASDRLSGRLYYAPHYFNEDAAAFYAELNGTHALDERFRLQGHVGWLQRSGHGAEADCDAERRRVDARAGIGARLGQGFDLQLARVASKGSGGCYSGYPASRDADDGKWILSVSRAW
jgi:uncharacterized protein (TIGR02001 family)